MSEEDRMDEKREGREQEEIYHNLQEMLEHRTTAIGPGELPPEMEVQYEKLIDALLPEDNGTPKSARRRALAKADLTAPQQSIAWAMCVMADTMEDQYQVSSRILDNALHAFCATRTGSYRKGRSEIVQILTNFIILPAQQEPPKKKSFIEKFFGM
jgi:hypothetical protein